MSSSAVARLVVGSLFAVGAVTLAIHLADEPASSAAGVSPASAVQGIGTTYAAAPRGSFTATATTASARVGTRAVLESTLRRPRSADGFAPGPVPVDMDPVRGVIPGFESLGPIHVDPVPPGVSLDDPTDTASLYARADLAMPDQEQQVAGDVPPGTPSTAGLTQHVAPSCSGTGTDGKRVQALYVRETTTASRLTELLPLFRNEIANVDDVFAVSARQSGGERRVRWVHSGCVPVVKEVVVADGALNASFTDTIKALQSAGYTDRNRKYLAFVEANNLCGVGTMYEDPSRSTNYNDGYAASYSRVDEGCWSSSGHSVAAHELTHNLGGVLASAPHSTKVGHCYDESDLMCYPDGSAYPMRTVCASAQEQLLDCNGDDYFNTAPPAGSFLANNWNTASSGFLDTPAAAPAPDPLTVTATASTTSAETGDVVTATATSAEATTFRWTASQPCTLDGAATTQVGVLCPATVTGPVVLSVTASDSGGRTATASATVTLTRSAAPTAGVVAPAQVAAGDTFALSAQVAGKAPFTYRWSATVPCTVFSSTSSAPQAACSAGSDGQSSSIGLTVTQADGQVVQAAPAVVAVAGTPPTTDPTATAWSGPTVTSRDPALLSAVLTDVASGSPLAGEVVELQTRPDAGQPWQTATGGLVTGADGRVSVERRRTTAAWYRFAYAGDPAGSHTAGVSDDVFVKARTTVKADWHGRRHLVTGRLLTLDGAPLGGVTVTLERRYAGSSRWVSVTRVTSAADGRLAVKQRPRRTAYFRWSYRGSDLLLPARSASVRAVRPSA